MESPTCPRFYTLPADVGVDYPWVLVNWFNRNKLKYHRFKHAILDSGVNRVFFNWRRDEYPPWLLRQIGYIAQQLSMIYKGRLWVTIPDYPDDYYPGYVRDNVERTLRNIKRFLPIEGVEWLPVIQSRYLDIFSFYESCERTKQLVGDYPRIAIGTVCKTRRLSFIEYVVKYARNVFPNSWIHCFGMTLQALRRLTQGEFNSFDNTVWDTRKRYWLNSFDNTAYTFPRKPGQPSAKCERMREQYFKAYLQRIKEILNQ